MPSRPPLLWLSAFAAVAGGCSSSSECEQAKDCGDVDGEPGVCLEDLDRGERYCTSECELPLLPQDDPCPLGRQCAPTGLFGQGGVQRDVCVESVFECATERCGNGLDDDCNGETDETPCDRITCWTDGMCGDPRLSACVLGDGTRECEPIIGQRNTGSKCASNDDCYNRHCAEGYCAPACSLDDDACPPGYACVNTNLGFNACLLRCFGSDLCNQEGEPDGTCVNRAVCTDPDNPDTCFAFRDVCVR